MVGVRQSPRSVSITEYKLLEVEFAIIVHRLAVSTETAMLRVVRNKFTMEQAVKLRVVVRGDTASFVRLV